MEDQGRQGEDCPCECVRCGRIIRDREYVNSIEFNVQKLLWKGGAVCFETCSSISLLEFCDDCQRHLMPDSLSLTIQDKDGKTFTARNIEFL